MKIKFMPIMLIMVLAFAFTPCKAFHVEVEMETAVVTKPTEVAPGGKFELPENAGEANVSNQQFRVQIEYGLNGIVKNGSSMPISVRVTNLSDDFEGTLRIIAGTYSSSSGSIAYDHDLMIAKGASKTFEITTTNTSYGTLRIGVEILDLKEKVLLSDTIDVNANYYEYAFTGVLSDDFTALNYFDGVEIQSSYGGVYYSSVVELEADDIPDSSAGLSCLSYLIINSFDTSQLSDAQYEAIQGWVSQGGILLIGTGPDYRTTLSMFDDAFLEGDVNEIVAGELEVLPALQKGFDGVISFKKGHEVHSIFVKDAKQMNVKNLYYDEALSLIQKKEIGKGAVVVTGFNLGLEPIDSLNWNDYFATAILNDATTAFTTDVFESGMKGNVSSATYQLYNLLDMLFNVKVPNIGLYALFFIVYVLIAGPVGYLILKSKDKREWIWGLIPTSAILFTVFLAFLSIPSRITKPIVSNFTVMNIQDNVVSKKIYMALQTPDTKEYTIQLQPGYHNFSPLKMSYSGTNNNSRNNWDYRIKDTPEGYQIITNHHTTFTTDYMIFEEIESNKESYFDLQLNGTTAYFSGSVTNRTGYDLVDAFVCYGNLAVYLGEFKNGETKTFGAGETMNIYGFYSWNLYDYLESSSNVKYKIENAYGYICELYQNTLDYDQGIVMGYVPSMIQDLVSDDAIEESGASLVYQEFSLQPEDIKGTYIDNLFNYVVNPNYNELDFGDHMMYTEVVDVEFNVPLTSISKVMKKTPNEWGGNYENVIVYGYNHHTGDFDQWFIANPTEMEFDTTKPCPYIGENGKMMLRFECKKPYGEYAPGIALIGG